VTASFSASVLDLDPALAWAEIETAIGDQVFHKLHRRGVVLSLSGGVDSSVVASLCVRALGAEKVFPLFMLEQESAPESLCLDKLVPSKLGVASATESITPILIAAGYYRRRDEASPLTSLDVCLLGKDPGISADQVASAAGLSPKDVERIHANIDVPRCTATYLHQAPLLVTPVPQVGDRVDDRTVRAVSQKTDST
jgi:hypothetical protein